MRNGVAGVFVLTCLLELASAVPTSATLTQTVNP
jgi:hypothetical protein